MTTDEQARLNEIASMDSCNADINEPRKVWFDRRFLLAQLAAREAEIERLRAAVSELLELVPPCDTDNPRVKLWCSAHQAKRCDGDDVRSRARASLDAAAERTDR